MHSISKKRAGLAVGAGLLVAASGVFLAVNADQTSPLTLGIPDCSVATPGQQCDHNMVVDHPDEAHDYRSGEPEIAINPSNPKNMVYVSTKYKRVEGAGDVDAPGAATEAVVPGTLNCYVFYTFDGGKSWHRAAVPLGSRPECADPMVVVDPSSTGPLATFYIAFDWAGGDNNTVVPKLAEAPPYSSHDVAVAMSTNGGQDWSEPVATGTTSDRPFFRIDPSTRKLYEASGDYNTAAAALFLAERGVQGDGRYLAVSSDHGKTWAKPVAFPGTHMAVNNGFLVTARQLQALNQSVPLTPVKAQSGDAQFTFYVSKDDGQSFQSFPVTGPDGNPVTGAGEYVSADPTTPGRFAVMQLNDQGMYEVYFTTLDAAGKPQGWSAPVLVGPGSAAAPNKPWMDFGPNGDLGVMWKTNAINVYAAILRKGRAAFTQPVRVNNVTFSAEDPLAFAGDDLSWIVLDNQNAYIGWGDLRTGDLNTFFGRVPLSKFQGG